MKPDYLLNVDEIEGKAIGMIVRTDDAGVTTGQIKLPPWQELPADYDGPHRIDVALHLADSYAEAYGYYAISVDIESSQLWDPAWGALNKKRAETHTCSPFSFAQFRMAKRLAILRILISRGLDALSALPA